MILVMGASSSIGRELVRELQAAGVEFKAGYRSAAQAAEMQMDTVETTILDYAKPETLRAALRGVEKLFFVSPPLPNLVELESNVVEAAQKAGVKHLVKLSVWGADGEEFYFGRLHAEVERKIEASGLGYTFLRPNGFMQNMLGNAATIKEQNAFYLPAGDARISEIDVRDIGRVAASVLTGDGHEGKAYELNGPEALSGAERAEILTEMLGKKINYVSLPDAEWKKVVLGYGLPEWLVDGIIDLQHYYKTGKAARVSPYVKEITGREPISFRRFVEDHTEAFQ